MFSVNHVSHVALISLVVFLAPLQLVTSDITVDGNVLCTQGCIKGVSFPQPFAGPIQGAVLRVACVDANGKYTSTEPITSFSTGAFLIGWADESTFSVQHCFVYVDHVPGKCNVPLNSEGEKNGYRLIFRPGQGNSYTAGSLFYQPAAGTQCPFT